MFQLQSSTLCVQKREDAFGGIAQAVPGGGWVSGPPCPQDFFKIMQFSVNFMGKTPILRKFWAQGPPPPLGSKLHCPPDQNPGSVAGLGWAPSVALAHRQITEVELVCASVQLVFFARILFLQDQNGSWWFLCPNDLLTPMPPWLPDPSLGVSLYS